MPYRIRKRGNKWVVQKVVNERQEQVGAHDDEQSARRQLTALRIAERRERG